MWQCLVATIYLFFSDENMYLVSIHRNAWPKESSQYLILKVYFMTEHKEESKILGWMGEWSKHCGVEFEKTTYIGGSDIRISFKNGKVDRYLICHAQALSLNNIQH